MALKEKTAITSDVTSRLSKIREGIVYSDPYTFIDELVQNAQRAKATVVYLTLNDRCFEVDDNGSGCKDPKDLLTLDLSGFGIGFGEGFTSVYSIADIVQIETQDWKTTIDIADAIKNSDLSVSIERNGYYKNGFKVSLTGEKICQYHDGILERTYAITAAIPNIAFYLNGQLLPKKDLLALDYYPSNYHQVFDNRMYTANLVLNDKHNDRIHVYNEFRHVMDLHFYGVSGVILLKPNAVNLRVPDRKAIIRDEKYEKLDRKIRKDVEYLLKEVLKSEVDEDIEKFSDIIEFYLELSEYIRFLTIKDDSVKNQYETRNNKKSTYTIGGISIDTVDTDDDLVTQTAFTHGNTKRQEADQRFISYVQPAPQAIRKEDLNKISIRNIKHKKNVVWVEKQYAENKQTTISQYEYYGIFTFVSPHVLYDRALRHLGIPHIDDIEDTAIQKEYSVTRTGAITKKEERAMELLRLVEQALGLPETFYISDIKCKKVVRLRETTLYKEDFPVGGYAQGNIIQLNRKSLKLGKLSSIHLGKESLGIHDLAFLLGNWDVISHECAHVLRGTKDNTQEHFEAQIEIQNMISEKVMNRVLEQ